jgi:hypothetical protein
MGRTFFWALAVVLALTGAACQDRPALRISPNLLPDASVGVPYDQRIDVSQNVTPVGAFSVQDGALPSGLSIEKLAGDDAAGRIVGTPRAAGRFTFTVYVWCYGTSVDGQRATKQHTLTVT